MASDAYVTSEQGLARLSQEERNNLRFHMAMHTAALKVGRLEYSIREVLGLDPESFDASLVASSAAVVAELFRARQEQTGDTTDKVAKSGQFVRDLEEKLAEKLS